MSIVTEASETKKSRTSEGRTITGVVNSIETLEGGGFLVRRPFPKPAFSDFDPFLLLDEMGPMDVAPRFRAETGRSVELRGARRW